MYIIAHNLDNYVDGKVLMNLSESELLEMIPPIGLVKNILTLTEQRSTQQVCTQKSKLRLPLYLCM